MVQLCGQLFFYYVLSFVFFADAASIDRSIDVADILYVYICGALVYLPGPTC